MKYRRKLTDIVFYATCFFLLAQAIYRLAFIVPPRPWEPGYAYFKIISAVSAIALSGGMVLLSALAEYILREHDDSEE